MSGKDSPTMDPMSIKDFFQEFKTFAVRGNMVELAVGLILGAGFNGIVKSLVDDVVMPPIGFLLGKVDFADLAIYLGEDHYDNLEAARAAGAPVIAYGQFLNNVIGFLFTALIVFFVVRQVNRWQK